ncbi:hypothetical protein Tco_0095761, partial [Tanacetum coccineum]
YEVELTDEEFSDNEDEVAEVLSIDGNIFYYKTPLCLAFNEFNYLLKVDPDLLSKDIMRFKTYEDYKDDWIYEWNKNVSWVYDKPWLDNGIWKEPTPAKHHFKPFNYKTGCSEWSTCSWREDGYCNGGNLLGAYVIRNSLHYQDLEWKRWNMYTNYDDAYKINHDVEEKERLCEIHELPVCIIRRFEMVKYSFRQDEVYVAIKEDEYNDLARTSEDACRAYQEIFRMIDEGWMVT